MSVLHLCTNRRYPRVHTIHKYVCGWPFPKTFGELLHSYTSANSKCLRECAKKLFRVPHKDDSFRFWRYVNEIENRGTGKECPLIVYTIEQLIRTHIHFIHMDEKHTHWNCDHREYTCADGIVVVCKFNNVEVDAKQVPQNGFWLREGELPVLVISGL